MIEYTAGKSTKRVPMTSCGRRHFCAGFGLMLAGGVLGTGGARGAISLPRVMPSEFTYEPIGEIGPPGTSVLAIAWHPEGQLLAAASQGGSIQLWDVSAKQRIWEFRKYTTNRSISLNFTPDGKHLIIPSAVISTDIAFSLISVETGRVARNIDRPAELDKARWATSWALNATGTRLATSFYTAHPIPFAVYDTADWHVVAVIDSPSFLPHYRNFAFDPISDLLATEGSVAMAGSTNLGFPEFFELWDVNARRLVKRRPLTHGIPHTYIPNSHLLLFAAVTKGHVTLLDVENDTISATMDIARGVRNLAVNRDGTVFSATYYGGLSLWRTTEDHKEITAHQRLEVVQTAIGGSKFNPVTGTMAFAANNQLCLTRI